MNGLMVQHNRWDGKKMVPCPGSQKLPRRNIPVTIFLK